jgi:NAD(P)H-hydrate epimerase
MATGGTGDVLTGVIAAWLAQLLDPEAATRVGVYLHGQAGALAAAAAGAPALVAGDILRPLGAAWRAVAGDDAESRAQLGDIP